MTNIPIVNFTHAINGTNEAKEHVAQQIDDAFQNVGFVYLKNHSVPLDLVEKCFQWVSAPQHLTAGYRIRVKMTNDEPMEITEKIEQSP